MNHNIKFFAVIAAVSLLNRQAAACPWCRARVESGIYEQDFFGNFLLLMLPLLLIGAGGLAVYYADKIPGAGKREDK